MVGSYYYYIMYNNGQCYNKYLLDVIYQYFSILVLNETTYNVLTELYLLQLIIN